KRAVNRSSTMCSWPTMTLAISSLSFLRALPSLAIASRSLWVVAWGPAFKGLPLPATAMMISNRVRQAQRRRAFVRWGEGASALRLTHPTQLLIRHRICAHVARQPPARFGIVPVTERVAHLFELTHHVVLRIHQHQPVLHHNALQFDGSGS